MDNKLLRMYAEYVTARANAGDTSVVSFETWKAAMLVLLNKATKE